MRQQFFGAVLSVIILLLLHWDVVSSSALQSSATGVGVTPATTPPDSCSERHFAPATNSSEPMSLMGKWKYDIVSPSPYPPSKPMWPPFVYRNVSTGMRSIVVLGSTYPDHFSFARDKYATALDVSTGKVLWNVSHLPKCDGPFEVSFEQLEEDDSSVGSSSRSNDQGILFQRYSCTEYEASGPRLNGIIALNATSGDKIWDISVLNTTFALLSSSNESASKYVALQRLDVASLGQQYYLLTFDVKSGRLQSNFSVQSEVAEIAVQGSGFTFLDDFLVVNSKFVILAAKHTVIDPIRPEFYFAFVSLTKQQSAGCYFQTRNEGLFYPPRTASNKVITFTSDASSLVTYGFYVPQEGTPQYFINISNCYQFTVDGGKRVVVSSQTKGLVFSGGNSGGGARRTHQESAVVDLGSSSSSSYSTLERLDPETLQPIATTSAPFPCFHWGTDFTYFQILPFHGGKSEDVILVFTQEKEFQTGNTYAFSFNTETMEINWNITGTGNVLPSVTSMQGLAGSNDFAPLGHGVLLLPSKLSSSGSGGGGYTLFNPIKQEFDSEIGGGRSSSSSSSKDIFWRRAVQTEKGEPVVVVQDEFNSLVGLALPPHHHHHHYRS